MNRSHARSKVQKLLMDIFPLRRVRKEITRGKTRSTAIRPEAKNHLKKCVRFLGEINRRTKGTDQFISRKGRTQFEGTLLRPFTGTDRKRKKQVRTRNKRICIVR